MNATLRLRLSCREWDNRWYSPGEYRGGLDMYQLQGFHARLAPLQGLQ